MTYLQITQTAAFLNLFCFAFCPRTHTYVNWLLVSQAASFKDISKHIVNLILDIVSAQRSYEMIFGIEGKFPELLRVYDRQLTMFKLKGSSHIMRTCYL